MIQLKHVVKYFGRYCALSDITMHVPEGAIYGLIGSNGTGKSTIIRSITGIYRPNSGEILIKGEPIFENPSRKGMISYIPDDMFYFFSADTMEMKQFFAGIYKNFSESLFVRLQEFFPGIDMKRSIRRLSKGMQKQIAFYLALCCRPEILILDDTMDGLDPVIRHQLWSLILNEVSDRKTTVLVSSHNLQELEVVCDHVGFLHQGQILLERSIHELQSNVSKIQVAFKQLQPAQCMHSFAEQFELLHVSNTGRVHTLIIRGNPIEVRSYLETLHPLLINFLPLTLEEIFIHEMGGVDYAVKDVLF